MTVVPFYKLICSMAAMQRAIFLLDEMGKLYFSGSVTTKYLGNVFTQVQYADPIGHMSCGFFSFLAVTRKNEFLVWGSNTCGQLALEQEEDVEELTVNTYFKDMADIVKLSSGVEFSAILLQDGKLYVCGFPHNCGIKVNEYTIIVYMLQIGRW